MATVGLPILFALFLWWFSTGAILYLDGLPKRTHRWTLLGATIVLVAALAGLAHTASVTSLGAAYSAFTCGLLVWGWVEVTFLLGLVTGPEKTHCPPEVRGWPRFVRAVRAILYHEVLILVMGALIVALTWGEPNQIALWTYALLWVMRLSTKLNMFLGARNLSEELLPDHLSHLKSFFRRRRMNALFPVSVLLTAMITAWFVYQALQPGADPFAVAGYTFLATLAALALIEHGFLMLPVPVAEIWSWGMRSHRHGGRPDRRAGETQTRAAAPAVAGDLAVIPARVGRAPLATHRRRS